MSRTFKKSQVISQTNNAVFTSIPPHKASHYVCATTQDKRVENVTVMKSNGQEIKGATVSQRGTLQSKLADATHTTGNMLPARSVRKSSRFVAKSFDI